MAENEILKTYSLTHKTSFEYLNRGVEILKSLLNRGFDAYIVGEAVSSYYLNKDIEKIEIVSAAVYSDLKLIYPRIELVGKDVILKDKTGLFYFSTFDKVGSDSKKNTFYNQALYNTLSNRGFGISALALSPNYKIIDLFNGREDLDNLEVIRPIQKAKDFYSTNPNAIFETLILASKYDLLIEKKTLKQMTKNVSLLSSTAIIEVVSVIRRILKTKNAIKILTFAWKEHLFEFNSQIDLFIGKLVNYKKELTFIEQMSLLYLIIGSIPDASNIENEEISLITDNMTYAQLVSSKDVTPMMVYNIGLERLLSADKLALLYKSKYKSQEKRIKSLNNKMIIKNVRELNYSSFELINHLGIERNIKVKIIMNLLLEKVINGEIANQYNVLKEEARVLNVKFDDVFNNSEDIKETYTNEDISSLIESYKKDFSFLVRIYLSDENGLYSLTAVEREQFIIDANKHAKEFLSESAKYKILMKEGLI